MRADLRTTVFGEGLMRFRVFAAVLLLALGSFSAQALDLNTRKQFDIPAQQLSSALIEFGRQTNVQVMTASTDLVGLQAGAVHGVMTLKVALERLLAGTDLRYEEAGVNSITIGKFAGGSATSSAQHQSFVRVAQASGAAAEQRPQTPSAADAKDEADSGKIGEIIVTATKRAQRLEDVPMSITAISKEEIERRGLTSAEDYLRGIPGVNQVENPISGGTIVIRGLESNPASQNFYAGTTVATYFGETATTNSAGVGGNANIDLKLVDIERIEVLRGPQGTTFGNSSIGGAVRTIPVAPQLDRFEGRGAVGYSATSGSGGENYNVQGVGNIPLIKDRVALRAVGYHYSDSGFYRNVAGSDSSFQAAAAAFGVSQSFITNDDQVGDSRVTGGRISALFQISDAAKLTLSYLKQKGEVDGQPIANQGTYEQTYLQVPSEVVVRGQKNGSYDNDIDLANALFEYDFGWAGLLGTYSYIDSSSLHRTQAQFVRAIPWTLAGEGDHREDSGEMRLTTRFSGPWNFLVGVFAEDVKDDFGQDYYWYGSAAADFIFPGQAGLVGGNGERRHLKQKAAFAEISWQFAPGFTLTGGARRYDYDRTGTTYTGLVVNRVFTDVGTSASGTSFRGNLSYKIGEDALVYASWAQGFRLGVPQAAAPAGLCDTDNDGILDNTNITMASMLRVESDNVDSYEIGGKFTMLDRRLMVAADVFRMDWDGLPVNVVAPCNWRYRANAGGARSEGVEFQATFYATEALRVDVGSSWIRPRLTTDALGLSPPAFAGDRLPGSPRVNANLGVQYDFKLGGYDAFVRADPIYVGPFYGFMGEPSGSIPAGDYIRVDASARLTIRGTNIDLIVRNLTNADEFTWRGGSNPAASNLYEGYRLRPRTVGLQLSRNF